MFSGATQQVRRFSLLLLEEGELYLTDYVATARWPPGVAGNWQRLPRLPGQLRLCTRSLFFEPDDARVPIVRLPFQYVEGLEGSGDRCLTLTASRLVKMRANAADSPYTVERAALPSGPAQGGEQHRPHSAGGSGGSGEQHPGQQSGVFLWELELSYATLEGVMPLAQQMVLASRLPPVDQEEFLQATMAAAEASMRFDVGHLRSPGERIELELGCTLLSEGALVRQPGRLLLTDQRLYFQPLHPISGDAAVRSHPLAGVAAAARRRSSLRELALEVFFAEPSSSATSAAGRLDDAAQQLAAPPHWGGASALFAFPSRADREQAVAALRSQAALGAALPGGAGAAAACSAILEADPAWLGRVTSAWQRGQLSNLDYLLFLNLASGRSFSDLSQYPVMPWVLADYSSTTLDLSNPAAFRDLSRPVGALNPRRLEMLRERYREMAGFSPEPAFLYGSHYSTPGFTMFWLVRAAPAHMLRLQAGRFDAPDRLFCGVREAWEGVTSANPADVKELIPEFFLRHDFLLNMRGLALGTRQNGRPVGDVELPPWADASAQRFLAAHRAALEAPCVSANLHHWIDLIFGAKQRGEAAVAADNVYRHVSYEGAVDVEAVADRTERLALETQIQEFGQCPRQLFAMKHPQRLVCPPAPDLAAAALPQAASGSAGDSQALPLALVATILAAAERGQGESPRLEVSPLLAQLDVVAARQRLEAAAAAEAEAEAGAAAASSTAGSAQGEEQVADDSPSKQQGLTSAGSRLRMWATERKQAVGERLAGSVGAVRDAAAAALASSGSSEGGVARSGGSASRLQALFNRKGSASSSAADVAAAAASAVSAADAAAAAGGGAAAAVVPQSGLPSPPQQQRQSGAGRMAAGLVGSIGEKLASLRGPQPSSPPRSPASAGSQNLQQLQQQQAQQPAEGAGGAGGPAATTVPQLWKFSRRAPPGSGPAAAVGDSSDEEEQQPAAAVPGGLQQQQQQQQEEAGPSSTATLLEAQRQRMLRQGLSESAAAAAQAAPAAAAATGGARPGWYGPGLHDRLAPTRVLVAGSESANGCALAAVGGELHVYSVSHSGSLRVHNMASGEQVRAARLSEQPLTSVALVPAIGSGCSGGAQHPIALCGSFDACVHAYSADYGRQLGSFQAASDAVACVQVVGGSGASCRLLTASWDGSVKLWDLQEGRQPWDASFSQPTAHVAAPSGVWAMAASPDGHLVLAGTEDGLVAAWDLRQAPRRPLWQRRLAQDNYVGGLDLLPSGTGAVVAAADGALSLLDLRRGGEVSAAVVPSGQPLRCCATDGCIVLAGDEGGSLHLWDVSSQLDATPLRAAGGVWTPPAPNGLFPPLAAEPASPLNALAAAALPGGAPAGQAVVTAHEGGLLRCYTTA